MTDANSYYGLLGLDKLPSWVKAVGWLLGMGVLFPIQIHPYYEILSTSWFPFSFSIRLLEEYFMIFGPMCLALAWLRVTGIKWRYAVFFPLFMLIVLTPFVFLMIRLD